MLQQMFANAINEDDILSIKKKVSKSTTQLRMASFQGEDYVGIRVIPESSKTTQAHLNMRT